MAEDATVLRLTIDKSGERCQIVALLGSSKCDIEVDMLPKSFRESLGLLQEAILQCPATRDALRASRVLREAPASPPKPAAVFADAPAPAFIGAAKAIAAGSDERMVQEIGSQLFGFVFQRSVLELYGKGLAAVKKNDQKGLSIRLHVKHPDLSYVPWETLYDKVNRSYVAASPVTPLIRAADDIEDDRQLAGSLPLRILGMAARAKILNGIPLDVIEVDAEQVAIREALAELEDAKKVILSWIPSAKARDLNRRFIKGDEGKRWDIFHFIGHGGYDADRLSGAKGFIVVQEDGGSKGEKLYADDLRNFVTQPGKIPSLVVLNSCSGAQASPGELFSSTAIELVQGGVPAVIAMQFEISDYMGIRFSNTFYTYLADGLSIQEALTQTRVELKAKHISEWISPVLYMRGLNGEIFVDRGHTS